MLTTWSPTPTVGSPGVTVSEGGGYGENCSDVNFEIVLAVAFAHDWLTMVPTRWLASSGYPDVTPALLDLVLAIGDEGMPLVALRARRGTSKQALARLVGEAERRGYVVLDADPTDGRSKIAYLTTLGHPPSRTGGRSCAVYRGSSRTPSVPPSPASSPDIYSPSRALWPTGAGSPAPVSPVGQPDDGTANEA